MQPSLLVRRLGNDAGTTLVEVLAAIVVFALLASAVLATLLKTIDLTGDDTRRVTAANVAARQIEIARHMTLSALQGTQSPLTYTYTVSGKQYTVTQTTAATTECGTATCTGGISSAVLYERVTVVVTWPGMGATKPVRSDTLRQIVGPGAVTTGAIGITVNGADGSARSGVSVQVSNAGGQTWVVVTDANGLALVTNLPPGTGYTASATASGYVDPSDRAVASVANLSVTPGQTTTATLVYDRSGSITYTETAPSGYVIPGPPSVTVVGATAPALVVTSSGSPPKATATGLYPDPRGYSAWAGDCADADPRSYAGGAVPPTNAVGTTSATVPTVGIGLVPLHLGIFMLPTNMYAIHAPDTGCTKTESVSLGKSLGLLTLNIALPYGHWTIASNSTGANPPVGGWTVLTVSPTVANPSSPVYVAF